MSAKIEYVAVVGCGVIGASWAAHFLAQGRRVTACDPSPGAESQLRSYVETAWPLLERIGLKPGASPDHLRFEANAAKAVAEAQFVQEAGPERLEIKCALFAELDRAASPDVILASSSSGLRISDIQTACVRPERVVLGHPFNPPHLIPLVEVIGGQKTSAETVARALEFYRDAGKSPIHIRQELKGHVANRLQGALWQEAIHLVASGAISVEDLDTAIAQGPGLRWALLGPFANMQLGGGAGGVQHFLEHVGLAAEEWWADLGRVHLTPELITRMAAGMDEALRGRDPAKIAAARDELLVKIMTLKAATRNLP